MSKHESINMFDTMTPEEAAGMSESLTPEIQSSLSAKGNMFDIIEAERAKKNELNSAQAFGLSVGKGIANTARGMESLFNMATGSDSQGLTDLLNIPSKQSEKRAFDPLEKKFPISTTLGEITGEILATLPAGGAAGAVAKGAVGVSQGGALAARFIPAIATGATEGAIIGADDGNAVFGSVVGGGSAATAEALLPPVARRLKRFFGKAKPLDELVTVVEGKITPTKETIEVLGEVGLDFEDIAREAQNEILNPQQAAVKGAFKAEGIEPASRTRIRPNASDIQREGFLLRQGNDEGVADAFREKVVAENEAIKNRFSSIADDLGVGGEEGADKLKTALFDIQSNMRSARNRAYEDLASVASDKPDLLTKIPLNESRIVQGVREAADLGLDDSTEKAVVRAFEDFGLVEKAERKGGLSLITGDSEIEKLSIANLHLFRKRINSVFDPTKPKEVLARRKIIESIDDVESEIVDSFEGASFEMPKIIQDAAKRARQTVIDEKKIFNERDLIESLVAPKAAGLNAKEAPLVAASKVHSKIMTGATTVENVRKLVNTLVRDGQDDSLEALGNLQASTMLDLLDYSVQPSKKLINKSGTTVDMFSGTRLENRIKKIGEDKIKAIFINNPDALLSLARLRKISSATITPEEAIQKGSLPPGVLNMAFDSISKIKGVPVVGELVSSVQKRSASSKISSFKPSQDDLIDFVVFENNPRVQKLLEYAGKYTPSRSAAAVITSGAATDKPIQEEQVNPFLENK